MKKFILGIVCGFLFCALFAFADKAKFSTMMVEKIGCDPDIYSDCQTDCYSLEAFEARIIISKPNEIKWCFTNYKGKTVNITLK